MNSSAGHYSVIEIADGPVFEILLSSGAFSQMSNSNDSGAVDIAALLPLAQLGDRHAMNDLLLHVAPFVRRLCLPIAHGHSADAAQEAMLAIFRGIKGIREHAAFYGWVRAVTVREAVRTSKRLTQRSTDELSELAQDADPSVTVDISDVIDRLPDHHRQVLTLRAVYGMEEQEMAAVLSLPVGTVRSRLYRARRNFQDAWDQHSPDQRPRHGRAPAPGRQAGHGARDCVRPKPSL